LNKQIDDTIESISGPEVAGKYKVDRRSASLLKDAVKAADEQAKRDQSNRTFGLLDMIAGGAGATAGAISGPFEAVTGFLAATAISKLMKEYGSSTTAKMMQTAADIMQKEGFEAGIQSLSALYGADTASSLANALVESSRPNQ